MCECRCNKTKEVEKSGVSLTAYGLSGNELSFRDVEVIKDNDDVLAFSYISRRDGRKKVATIYKDNVIGFSLDEGK